MFGGGWDDELDDAQSVAVTHGDGPLVIVAGAGTGKTRTLTQRVAHLLEQGVAPQRILLLTFTRRAADDMLARAAAIADGVGGTPRLVGGTFHAVAHRILRTWGAAVGLPPGFSVIDPGDVADLMDLLREAYGLAGTTERTPKPSTLANVYSRCVNTGRPLSEVVATHHPWCRPHADAMGHLYRAYAARKRERHQLDFDDLLLYWRAALRDERAGTELAKMFDFVLVDEYQDMNALQVDIVRLLRPDGRGLTVVGDDAQAIYRFRGAEARHLHELALDLPGATVVRLERNFRSLQPILDLANAVRPAATGDEAIRVELFADRPGGRHPVLVRCYDAAEEARVVVEQVLARHEDGTRLQDQAVLVRAAHHSDLIELELSRRRVPYRKYGGLRFVEAAHVKDFLAAARLVDNPLDDLAWFRLLRLHRGIGPARARALLGTLPPHQPVKTAIGAETVAAAPAGSRARLGATFRALAQARAAPEAGQQAELLVALLAPLVADRYPDSSARIGDLERLSSAARAAPDLGAFVAGITLDLPASSGDLAGPPHLDEDFVVLSTVHSAKGLEWPVVHLPQLVDGAFPSDMALGTAEGLAEEHRLFYVAVTRARDELLLYTPLRMPYRRWAKDDRHCFAPQSRFLDDRLLQLVKVEEAGSTPAPLAGPAAIAAEAVLEAVDLEHLWK